MWQSCTRNLSLGIYFRPNYQLIETMAKITEVLEDLKVEIEKLLEKLYELNATEPDVQRCEKVFHENNIYRALDKLKQVRDNKFDYLLIFLRCNFDDVLNH